MPAANQAAPSPDMSTATRPGETPTILTASGREYHILEPDPSNLHLSDIAIGLARCTRWSGQLGRAAGSFTVAEHSLHVVRILRALDVTCTETLYAGLMHDASEGLLGDMARPVKVAMRMLSGGELSVWDDIEDRAEAAVAERFDVPTPLPSIIKTADTYAQQIERHLFYGQPLPDDCLELPVPKRYSTEGATRAFIRAWKKLAPDSQRTN